MTDTKSQLLEVREWANLMATDYLHVFRNYIADKFPHDGDCTKQPYSCIRCAIDDTIKEAGEQVDLLDSVINDMGATGVSTEESTLGGKPLPTSEFNSHAPATPKPTLPLICIFGCKDPVVAIVYMPNGCTCFRNKYQPRCLHHLHRLDDTDGGQFEIVEDLRV